MLKKRTIVFSIVILTIAVIYGFFIENSRNIFCSVVLIGTWFLFVLKYFEKRKHYNEFNSPHNTPFFLFAPLFLGLFYNFWSYYTGILGENLFNNNGESFFYLSPWSLILAFPWLVHGLNTVRKCFKDFTLVYIFKTRSMGGKKFGTIYSICLLVLILLQVIYLPVIMDALSFIVSPSHSMYPLAYFDVMLFIFTTTLGSIFLWHGVIQPRRRTLPSVTPTYVSRRRRELDQLSRRASQAPTTVKTSRRTPRITTTSGSSRSSYQRTTPRRMVPVSSTSKRKDKSRSSGRAKSSSMDQYKPKAGILTLDDFKCIFCFKLPSLSADKNRGIVLCPKCKHPAHEDEFREWTKVSSLCSRCDAPLPSNFIRNPTIIPLKKYIEVIEDFKKRKK